MEIRKLDRTEHGATRKMYENIFPEDSQGFVDYYYTEKTKDNQIYVAEEDGGIRAMLHLNPYNMFINGRMKETNYIVAVATEEAYRRRGYMAALLRKALNDMYSEGQYFTFLMPAAESIYLPHDFRTVYEQEIEYYDPGMEFPGEIKEATEEDCEKLAELENHFLSQHYQVFAIRDEAYFSRLRKELGADNGKLMVFWQDGEIAGSAPYYPEDAQEENGEKSKIMIRIVDARRLLMTLKVKRLIGICFTITDPIIPENNRHLFLTGTEFSGLMLMDDKAEKSEGTITIAALGELVFGAKTVEEISQEEGVHMTEHMKEELAQIVPLGSIFLNEIV